MSIQEIVYERPDSINQTIHMSTYYKVSVLRDVMDTLFAVGGQPLVRRFLSGPFGHLAYWAPGPKCVMAVHHFLSRQIKAPGTPEHETWYHINGRNIRFSYPEFALVTGLSFGTSSFVSTDEPIDLSKVDVFVKFCGGVFIHNCDLLEIFNNPRHRISNPTGDLYLKVANVLVLYFMLLGYDAKFCAEAWVWKLVDDLESWNNFPWGAYSYQALRHYIGRIHDTKKYHFNGPVWAFLCWALEVFPELAKIVAKENDPLALPRCLKWRFKSKIGDIDLSALFEKGPDSICPMAPRPNESSMGYWLSTQYENALGVRYLPPKNPIKEGGACPRRIPAQGVVIEDNPRARREHQEGAYVEEEEPPLPKSRSKRDKGKRPRNTTMSSSSNGEDT